MSLTCRKRWQSHPGSGAIGGAVGHGASRFVVVATTGAEQWQQRNSGDSVVRVYSGLALAMTTETIATGTGLTKVLRHHR